MEQGLRRLWTLALAVVATCAGVLAAPVGASADGTIKVKKGGDRIASNSSITDYTTGLAGVRFEYTTDAAKAANPASTGWTLFTNLTDANGEATQGVPAGVYYVRENSVATGFTNYGPVKSLSFDPRSGTPSAAQPYVAKVQVTDGRTTNARPNRSERSSGFPDFVSTPNHLDVANWNMNYNASSGNQDNTLSPFINVRDNQPFPSICGLNLLLVLDRSGSIDSYKTTYRDAARKLVNSLADTPTQISIVSFSASANSYQDGSGDSDYTIAPQSLSTLAGRTALKDTIDDVYANPSGSTNWDAGLQKAAAAKGFASNVGTGQTANPDVVVFITDGNPTRNSTDDKGSGGDVDVISLTAGMASANSVKNESARSTAVPATKVKVYALGVANQAGVGSINANNLKAVSGPAFGEDYETPTVSQLESKLTELAARTCGARVYIRKHLTTDATNQELWKFTGTTDAPSPAAIEYLNANRATHTTDTVVQTGVLLTKLQGTSANVTINEDTTGQPTTNFALTSKVCKSGSYDGTAVNSTPTANGLTVNVPRGGALYCTFTNAPAAKLELRKQLAPTTDTGKFNLLADGASNDVSATDVGHNGSSADGGTNVAPGTYALSETAGTGTTAANYDMGTPSCKKRADNSTVTVTNGSITLATDQDVICTWVNTRLPRIELKKQWAGLGSGEQTTLRIGAVQDGTSVANVPTGANGTAPLTTDPRTVQPGTYYVSENGGLGDYNTSLACKKNGQSYTPGGGQSVVLAAGDTAECTFTNTRKQGTIALNKIWSGTGGQTTLGINGPSGSFQQQTGVNGSPPLAIAAQPVMTGTYTLSETGGLENYDAELSCKIGNGQPFPPVNSQVTVGDGQNVVCTFTNTRKTGKLTLVKHLIGGGSDRFSLKVDGVAQTVSPGGGTVFGHNDSTGQMTKNTGTYTISEDAISPAADADYVEELSCVNGTAPADTDGTITIGKNDNWVCTFTNTRKQGSIELKKSWTGGDPGQTTLKIGTSAGGGTIANQQTGPNGTGTQSTGTKTVDTGAYYVSEDGGLANFDSSLACKKNGQDYTPGANGQVNVGLRDAVVCTYTNDRHRGTIEVKKQWVGPGSGGQTTLKIGTSAGGSQVDSQQTGANGGAPLTTDAESVVTGTYYVSESGGLDDFDSSLACKKNGQDYTPGANDSVTVGKNDTVVCTFTNTRKQGTVQVKKVWTGDEPGQTTLQIGTGAGGDSVTSQQTGANGAAPLETDVKTVPTGTYYVSETGGLTNHTGSLACKKNGQDYTPGANDSVTVGKDDAVVCTFTNTRKTGTIQVKKIWSGPGSGGQTTLNIGTTLNGSETTSQPTGANGGTPLATDVKTVPTGDYYVSETGGLSDYNASLACERDGQPYIYGAGNRVSVGKDEDIVCTFTNARKSGTLVLEKSLRPSNNSDQFNLRYDGTAATVDSQAGGTAFGDGDRSTQIKLATGVPVTLTETAVSPADLGDYDRSLYCWSNYDESGGFTPENNVITLRENEFLNCTWTNVKKARVTIKKVVSNPVEGDGPAFGFTTTLPDHPGGEGNQPIVAGEPNTFSLKNGQQTSVKVSTANGPFVVSEDDASGIDPGYLLTSIECTGQSAPPDVRLSLKEAESATAQQRSTTIEPQPGDEITCTFTNKRIVAVNIVVKKPETQAVYIDGTATYTYEVTNTGTSDLTDIAVADDKCSPVSGPNTGTDATPAVLNPGDTWTYSCSISAAALFGQTTAPITNTVTVTARDELGRDVPPSTDTAITKLLVPGIAIDKTVNAASQNAQAGDAITFDIVVTNTGNTSMVTVAVSDDLCPANLSGPDKGSDGSPATLDPGESWRYSCVVQTTAAQQGTAIRNVATVTGTDTGGKQPTATDDATQALPAVVTGGGGTEGQGVVNGRSRLTGTAGCVKSAYGTATVSGSNIAKVVFYVNGKKTKTLTKPNSGKNYRLKLRAKSLKYGNYKITARVTYVTGATPKSATLDRQFSRCRPKVAVTPKFTG